MEQILPALEGQLRRFRRNSAALALRHPRLAGRLGPGNVAPDAHVDRLVQGVAALHARSVLALQRAGWQRDEQALEALSPQQLRPFPACRIGPGADSPPVVIRAARFAHGAGASGPVIEIELEWLTPGPPRARTVDIFIDGDATFRAALRSALLGQNAPAPAVADARAGRGASASSFGQTVDWHELPSWPFTPCGLDPAEALLPRPPGDHAGLALLREFFVFPARFNLLRLDLAPFAASACWTLRLPLDPGDPAMQLLSALDALHLRAGWAASPSLSATAATPILLDGRQAEYSISVPPELEVFSIDRIQTSPTACGGTWMTRRVCGAAPGHEWRIAFSGHWPQGAVASINVSCCRREEVLARPARGPGCRWQLNSLLALEQLPLSTAALQELMATQAINASPASQAMIAAVRSLVALPVLLQAGRAAPLAGTELRLYIDQAPFAGSGLLLFAQVMARFFSECAHLNTFTRLVLVSAATGKELIRCKAMNAGILLE